MTTVASAAQWFNDFRASDGQAPFDALQSVIESVDLEARDAAAYGVGYISGLDVTADGTMTLQVAAGQVQFGSLKVPVLGGLFPIAHNDTDFIRIDTLRIDITGTIRVVAGNPGRLPASKPLHRDASGLVDEVLFHKVYVEPGTPNGILWTMLAPRAFSSTNAGVTTNVPVVFEPIISDNGVNTHLSYGNAFGQDYTFVDPTDGTEYILWLTDFREPVLGVRAANVTYWDYQVLSRSSGQGGAGNAIGVVPNDGHFYVHFGMDSAGFLHISGNMHNMPLNYIRSTYSMRTGLDINGAPPGGGVVLRDIHHWSGALSMTGANENRVTYPLFIQLPDDTLAFLYRNGSSGDGDHWIKRYDTTTHTWSDLGRVLDGTTDNVSAYPVAPQIDSAGNIHFVFDWRATGDADTNEGWYYMKIVGVGAGGAMQLQRTDGSTITRPARYHGGSGVTADMLPDKIADFPAPNLINATSLSVQRADISDRPHATFEAIVGAAATVAHPYGDPAATGIVQQFHLWYDPTLPNSTDARVLIPGWHLQQFTEFVTQGGSWAGGTPAGSASRWQILNTLDGRVFALGCWLVEGLGGSTWAVELTGLADTDPIPPFFKLHDFPDQGDFHYDFYSAFVDNKLRMLLVGGGRYYSDPGDPDADDKNIGNGVPISQHSYDPVGQPSPNLVRPNSLLGLLTIDLAQIDLLKTGVAKLPGLKIVGTSTAQGITNITTTTATGLGPLITANQLFGANGCALTIGHAYAGRQLFARMILNYAVSGPSNGWLATAIDVRRYQQINAQAVTNGEAVVAVAPISVASGDPTMICANHVEQAAPDPIIRQTGWRALPTFRDPSGDLGRLSVAAWTSGGGAVGTLSDCTIELAVLDF